jgi:mortality factor 4-like protein 1
VELLSEFAEYIKTTKPSQSVQPISEKALDLTSFVIISLKEPDLMIQTVISELQIYFDRALGFNLLYRFERAQYAQVRHD